MKPLTTKQNDVLKFVENYLSMQGFPPTLKEIGDALGLANINAVRGHLLAIEKKGYISKAPDRARSIQVIRSPSKVSLIKRKMHEILRTDEGVFHKVIFGLSWTTYLRKPYFTGRAKKLLEGILNQVAVDRGWKVIRKRIEPDHIVVTLKVWPNHSPERAVRRIQNASMVLKKMHPDLFPEKNIWDKGYLATTDMELFDEMVEQFLKDQPGNQ